jgi:hypothetical protein
MGMAVYLLYSRSYLINSILYLHGLPSEQPNKASVDEKTRISESHVWERIHLQWTEQTESFQESTTFRHLSR